MSKIIQSKYAYAGVLGPIFIKRRGDEAAAYYGVNMPMAQQADEFKSEFLLRAGKWELKSTKSVKPWYRRWK